jgi:hypothetical protein
LGGTGAPHSNNLISRFSLVDICRKQHQTDQQFTWKNKLGMIKCLVDKFYISSSLAKDYDIERTIESYPYSDHDIALITLKVKRSSSNVGPGVWKLYTSLLNDKTVRDKVVTFWTDWKKKKQYFSNVVEWWDTGKSRIKSLLIKCSKTKLIKSKQDRARVLKRYRTLDAKENLSASEVEELDGVKSQLASIDFQRVQGNKIRCKAKWIKANEQPSSFFFQTEKKRTVKKTCQALHTADGRRVTDQEGIMSVQVKFYKTLYSKVPTDSATQDRLLKLLERKLTDGQRDSCEDLFNTSECSAALKSMSCGKTPGSDGLPKEFTSRFGTCCGRTLSRWRTIALQTA